MKFTPRNPLQSKLIPHVLTIITLMTFLPGCGKSTEEAGTTASGTISLDGEPLTRGTIDFYPTDGSGNSAFAVINEDGTFTVNTAAGVTGLEPGSYKVVVTVPPTDEEMENVPEGQMPDSIVPEKYSDEALSDLTVDVGPEGANDIKLLLTSK